MSETGSCNNVKVVKPPGIFKELSTATQRERQRREEEEEEEEEVEVEVEGKVERTREQHREWRDLFQHGHENGRDQKGGGNISH